MSFGESFWITLVVLAIALGGAAIALLVARRTQAPEETQRDNADENNRFDGAFALWLTIGVAAGVAIGAAMGNVSVGIAIGVAIGIALASAQGAIH